MQIRLWVRYRTVFVPSRIQSPWVDVVRKLVRRSHEPVDPIETPKRTILFLAANPTDMQALALDREARAIRVELERSGYRDQLVFETRWATEPLDLLRELRRIKPAVIHYCGHGSPDGLHLQSASGASQLVSVTALAETLAATDFSVKVIVLNACYSDQLAGQLLAHAECVVGMESTIADRAARSFAIGFYGALGEHEPMATAFRQGCAAIRLEEFHDAPSASRDVGVLASGGRAPVGEVAPRLRVRPGVDADQLVLVNRTDGAAERRYMDGSNAASLVIAAIFATALIGPWFDSRRRSPSSSALCSQPWS